MNDEWPTPKEPENLNDWRELREKLQRKDFRYYWHRFALAISEFFYEKRHPMKDWEFVLRGNWSGRTETVTAKSNIRTMSEYDLVSYFEAQWDEPVYVVSWREL
jgi:hypothetical protein